MGILLISISLTSLLVLSLPLVSHALVKPLESFAPVDLEKLEDGQVIVVLGGGRAYTGREFGWPDAPSQPTISRLNYAAWLGRKTGFPLLLTGGRVHQEKISEAQLMNWTLQESFGLEARWLEEKSRTTHENALFTADLLQKEGYGRILLVSQAWHLARAVPVFEAQGLTVTPAPMQFSSPPPEGWIRWIPRAYHLKKSTQALHEWLGRLVYSFY